MDDKINEIKKIGLIQKVVNLILIIFGIIFLIGGVSLFLEGDKIHGSSSIIVGISFFPYSYYKVKSFLIGKEFSKKILNNYGKIYFFIFFLIFMIGGILKNLQEIPIKEQSNLSLSYSINKEITDKENIVLNLTQKNIDKIIINNKSIKFDKNQETINYTISLDVGKNIILIKGENEFYQKDFLKTITRLSEEKYKLYLDKLEEEKLQKEKEEQERIKKIEEERLEQERKEKMNYTGIWSIGNYVDEFGDKTGESYITNNQILKGTFSNTATKDSRLNIDLLINDKKDINIMLYEYSGNNPVKSYGIDWYTVNVKDKEGKKYIFRAKNTSDRLVITKSINTDLGAIDLHKILLKGGEIKFVIIKNDFPSEYKFTILNADGYDNIYRKKQGLK